MVVTCSCGLQLAAPGATPGRVGKCPRCGTLLRVPTASTATPPTTMREPAGEAEPPVRPARPAARVRSPREPRSRQGRGRDQRRGGGPLGAERSVAASLAYPLREAPAVALLVALPPFLWFGGVPLGAIIPLLLSGHPAAVFGLALGLPQLLLLAALLGHIFLFLGEIAVSSCLGAAHQPRPASWLPGDLVRAWGRWLWALLAGGTLGGLPATLYWVEAGDLDWFDRIILADLALPGVAYALMALLLTLVRETPWAAVNPILVARSLGRAGWGYVRPCLMGSIALLSSGALLVWCFDLKAPTAQVGAFYLWWLVSLYLSMVTLRILGLHCHRTGAIDL